MTMIERINEKINREGMRFYHVNFIKNNKIVASGKGCAENKVLAEWEASLTLGARTLDYDDMVVTEISKEEAMEYLETRKYLYK